VGIRQCLPTSSPGISRPSPDLRGFAAANGLEGKTDEDIRAAMGDKFPKHIYDSIIYIGALVAHQGNDSWRVDVLGAPSVAKRTEKEPIASFIAELKPQLVTFNGSSFVLPVLCYRAMVNGVSAPGLGSISIAIRKTPSIFAMS